MLPSSALPERSQSQKLSRKTPSGLPVSSSGPRDRPIDRRNPPPQQPSRFPRLTAQVGEMGAPSRSTDLAEACPRQVPAKKGGAGKALSSGHVLLTLTASRAIFLTGRAALSPNWFGIARAELNAARSRSPDAAIVTGISVGRSVAHLFQLAGVQSPATNPRYSETVGF